MILTFRQQEKLLAELIGPNEPQAAAAAETIFAKAPDGKRGGCGGVKVGTARRAVRGRRSAAVPT